MIKEQRVSTNKDHLLYPDFKIEKGQSLAFILNRVNPDGTLISFGQNVKIEKIIGTGFFGEVIFPEDKDFVIKTTTPSSPTKKLLRSANWQLEQFPSQINEDAAILDHLGTHLMHLALKKFSKGKLYSPESLGYTLLPNGYAQVLEKVSGRGPSFFGTYHEYVIFKENQKRAGELLYSLGFEQGSQIDADNPLGLPNFWFDKANKRWVVMDTLAAFQLKPTMGLVAFKFHKKAQERFYPDDPHAVPYNTVHTEILMDQMSKNKDLFTDEEYEEMISSIVIYREIKGRFDRTFANEKDFKDATKTAILAGKEIFEKLTVGIGKGVVSKVAKIKPLLKGDVTEFQKNLLLFGVRKAAEKGHISQEQLEELQANFQNKNLADLKGPATKATALATGYWGLSRMVNMAELGVYANLGYDVSIQGIGDLTKIMGYAPELMPYILAARIVGGAVRFPFTKISETVTGSDLKVASRVSWIPIIGDSLAVFGQFGADIGRDGALINHYNIRHLVSRISALHPLGGEGTDHEAWLMRYLGRWMENLVKDNKT
jgi:hypothetical protein